MSKITSSNFWQCSLGFFLIIASIVALIVGWAIYNGIKGESSNNTLVVNGEGKVYAKPDVAIVDMSVINQNIDVEKVQAENDEKTQKVINFLKESGVDEKDIKTLQYNLQPEYDYNWCRNASSTQYISYCPPKLVDYILTQTIEVKIRDLNNVGKIIGKLTDVGVNQVSSINFIVDEDSVYKSEARKEAVLDAQKRANDIAQTAGIKLGRIITINESTNNDVYPRVNYAKEALMDLSSASPIEIGSNEINTSISLIYEIIEQ